MKLTITDIAQQLNPKTSKKYSNQTLNEQKLRHIGVWLLPTSNRKPYEVHCIICSLL